MSLYSVLLYFLLPIVVLVLVVLNILSLGRLGRALRNSKGAKAGRVFYMISFLGGRFTINARDDFTEFIFSRFPLPKRLVLLPLKNKIIFPIQEKITQSAVEHYSSIMDSYIHIHSRFLDGMRDGRDQAKIPAGDETSESQPSVRDYILGFLALPIILGVLLLLILLEVVISALFILRSIPTLSFFVAFLIVAYWLVSQPPIPQ